MFVNSSAISQIIYSRKYKVMGTVFKTNPKIVYLHRNFSRYMWDKFKQSDSKGRFYNKKIRGQYTGDKMAIRL